MYDYNNLTTVNTGITAYNYSQTTYCGVFCGYQTTGYYNVPGIYFNSGQATSLTSISAELYVPSGYQGSFTFSLATGPTGSITPGQWSSGNGITGTYIAGDSVSSTLYPSSNYQTSVQNVNWAVTPNTNYELVLSVPYTANVETNAVTWAENPGNATLAAAVLGQYTTPVPLPGAAWLMLSGLGGLAVMVRKRRALNSALS